MTKTDIADRIRKHLNRTRDVFTDGPLALRLIEELLHPPELKFKRLEHGEGLPLPAYATPGAAGMDICSAEDVHLTRGNQRLIHTGFAVEVPPGYELQVRPRSGLAGKWGVTIPNTPGTIDEDYRGEIGVILVTHGEPWVGIRRGDRIAQLVLQPVVRPTIVEVEELTKTRRGEGGFGSTGA